MKTRLIDRITEWTRRNLRWMIPFVIIMPFFLWWWNAHLDAIGLWLWLALHGQKAAEIESGMVGFGAALLVVAAVWLALKDCFGKERK